MRKKSRARLRARFFAGAVFACIGIVGAACSLDLDENLINLGPDGGLPDGALPDGALPDGALPDAPPPVPDASTCTKDDDCKTTHGCLKGKCDLARKACVYDVCRNAACSSAACTTSSQTCGAAAPYKYRATSFLVGAQVIARAAAVHPYLFLGTGNGFVAFNMSNPANPNPPQVPVVGLGFIPNQFVTSGSRVYFLGNSVGANPSRLPIAWIDVPADPFAAKLTVQSALPLYNRPAGDGPTMLARGGDSALIMKVDQAQNYPTAFVSAPFVEPFTVTTTPLTFTAGTGPVAVSGTRLVMRGINGATNVFSFGLIQTAGGPNPQNLGDTVMADAGAASSEQYAQSADGAVLWVTHALTTIPNPNPPPPTVTVVRAIRAYFLIANEQANVDQSAGIDVETYNPPIVGPGGAVIGPSAMLDSKTAMVVHAAKENLNQTAVQFIRRDPLEVIKEGAAPKRVVLPIAPGTVVAAAGSNGVGYIVANDVVGPPTNATVYVFDPACPP